MKERSKGINPLSLAALLRDQVEATESLAR